MNNSSIQAKALARAPQIQQLYMATESKVSQSEVEMFLAK